MDIRIETLGGLRVFHDGRDLSRISRRPTRAALLVYLAVERDVTRDVVLGALWSRLDSDRARHALNQALYLLRKELGDDWLFVDGDRLRVTDALSVDALEFERRVKAGSFEDALPLYEGAFLEGWYLRDTPEFEHWTDRVRLRLSRLHGDGRRARLDELRREGRTAEALEVARAWVRSEPLQDAAHHALIELLALADRRAEALEHYEAYERNLARQDLAPLEETRGLVEGIRNGEERTTRPEAEGRRREGEEALERPIPESADPPGPEPGARRGRALRRLAAAAALTAAALLVFAALGDRSPAPTLDPARVLVYPLENLTGDAGLDPTGRLAADWITRGLARADFLLAVPSTEFLPAPEPATGAEGATPDYLQEAKAAAREAGCGTLVAGAFYRQDSEIEFHAQILAAPDWEVLESVGPIRADPADPMEAVDVLGQRVLIGLALRREESLAGMFAKSERPPSYAAYVAFAEGFRKTLAGQWREAAAAFMRANEISPEFTAPLIPAAVGLVWGSGDFRAADSVLRIAEASADRLPYYDRLRLELVRATLWGDHRRAYRVAKEAAAFLPGRTANYSVADLSMAINRPREALEALAGFDPNSRPGVRDFMNYWDTDTQARHLLGEHDRELHEAREGRDRFPSSMETLWYEVRALAALGRTTELDRLLDESLGVRASPALGPGLVMVQAAAELHVHGHSDGAEEVLTRFETWYQGLDPERKSAPDVHLQLGRARYLAGRLDAARDVFSELRAVAPGNPVPIRYLGTIAARTGDRETAFARSRELADLENEYLFGRNTLGRAAIAARLGDREEALALLRRATSEGVRFGTDLHADPDLSVLRDYPPYQEFMRPQG